MTYDELLKSLRDRSKARFDATADAYYYCNHSKKSARLIRKMARQLERVKFYDDILAKRNSKGGRGE